MIMESTQIKPLKIIGEEGLLRKKGMEYYFKSKFDLWSPLMVIFFLKSRFTDGHI